GDLDLADQLDTGDLTKRRVGLLRGRRINTRADATALRATLQRGRLRLAGLGRAALPDQLLDCGHRASAPCGLCWCNGSLDPTPSVGRVAQFTGPGESSRSAG